MSLIAIDFSTQTFEEKKRIVLEIIVTRFEDLSASRIPLTVFIHKLDYTKSCGELTNKKKVMNKFAKLL